jgi:acyl-[acyl-carrier-protein] desaturase
MTIIEGYYAVEQYAPDYTAGLVRLCRTGYGRSHFQVVWGSEETRHADAWRNVLLFSRARSAAYLDAYTESLRENQWTPPWDDPIRMLLYTVFQERATELIYLNTGTYLKVENQEDASALASDSVLMKVISTIAKDEAAHYNFYLEAARLCLHYLPEETLPALVDVLRNFTMPAASIIPNYSAFIGELYTAGIFGRQQYARDVVESALGKLGIDARQSFQGRLFSRRRVCGDKNTNDELEPSVPIQHDVLREFVMHLVQRLNLYEQEVGLSAVIDEQPVPVLI